MTTYRTDNHWGVTIVREPTRCCDLHTRHCEAPADLCCPSCTEAAHAGLTPHADGSRCVLNPDDAQLVAVVVNGDQALAERICALLNGDQDLGAQLRDEALAAPPVVAPTRRLRDCVERWADAETGDYDPRCCRFPKSCSASVYNPERVTEADLEPNRDAPPGPLSAPVSAQQPPVGGNGRPEGAETLSGGRWYCPDHPGPLDDARNHVCRLRPAPPSVGPGCICNDPPPTVDKPKNGTPSRPPGWACPRHGTVI